MRIAVRGIDRRKKPWFGKVVQTAQKRLSEELPAICREFEFSYFAQFNTLSSHIPGVAIHTAPDSHGHATVTFDTSEWQSIKQAIPYAVSQLASVLVYITAQQPFSNELRLALNQRGIPITEVTETTPEIKVDSRNHVMVFFDPSLISDELVADLYDSLDEALTEEKLGAVTGSGHGALGTTLDIALNDLETGIPFLRAFLKRNKAPKSTRIELEGTEQSWLVS
jgi:hypothetical protein